MTPGAEVLDRTWTALACGAALAVAVALFRFLRSRRRAGLLQWGAAPVLDLPPFEVAALLAAVLLAAGWLGGFWFGAVGIAGVAGLLRWNGHSVARHFGPGPLALPAVIGMSLWIALAVFVPLQLLAGGCEAVFHHFGWPTPPEPAIALFLSAHGWRALLGFFLAATVLAPLAEEILFRGLLQPVFRVRFPAPAAIAVTALLFAGLHDHGVSFLPLFLFGGVLGLAYELSGSLLLCIGIHFWFNALTALLLLTGNGPTPP